MAGRWRGIEMTAYPPMKGTASIEWTGPGIRDWEDYCVNTEKEALEIIGHREVFWRARGPEWRFSVRKNNG